MAIGSYVAPDGSVYPDADVHKALTRPLSKLPSFAKINWSLRILGKRPDGYHEVITVLQTFPCAMSSRFCDVATTGRDSDLR